MMVVLLYWWKLGRLPLSSYAAEIVVLFVLEWTSTLGFAMGIFTLSFTSVLRERLETVHRTKRQEKQGALIRATPGIER